MHHKIRSAVASVFLAFLLALAAPVTSSAQDVETSSEASFEQIASFLDKQGTVLVHLDLRRVDPQELASRFTAGLDTFLPQWGFDKKSSRGIMREWNLLLSKKLPLLTEPLDRLTKEAGVHDFFWVGPIRKSDEESRSFFAVPVKGKDDAQKEIVRNLFLDVFRWFYPNQTDLVMFERNDILIVPVEIVSAEETLSASAQIETFQKDLDSVRGVDPAFLAEIRKHHENDALRVVILPPKNIMEIAAEVGETESPALEPLKSLADTAQNDVRWFSCGLNPEQLRLSFCLRFKDENAAARFVTILSKVCEYLSEQIEKNTSENEIFQYFSRLTTVSFEETARMLMPRQEGDALVGVVDSSNFLIYYSAFGYGPFMIDGFFEE